MIDDLCYVRTRPDLKYIRPENKEVSPTRKNPKDNGIYLTGEISKDKGRASSSWPDGPPLGALLFFGGRGGYMGVRPAGKTIEFGSMNDGSNPSLPFVAWVYH